MQPQNSRVQNLIGSLYSEEEDLLYMFRDELILTQPRLIYRINGGGGDRYYYSPNQTNTGVEFEIYVSTTTFTKKVLPVPFGLIQWMKENGEESDAIRDLAADYGTLMHICIADFLISGYDFSATREIVSKYLERLGHHKSLILPWTKRINKDVAAFKQFCTEWEVEPILIEAMLASDEMGIAGTIDLVAKMRDPKTKKAYEKEVSARDKAIEKHNADYSAWLESPGKKKQPELDEKFINEPVLKDKVIGSVDFKSGKYFSDSHHLQLQINKLIFEENYPEVKIDISLNWKPNDWEVVPTYTIKDQTESRFGYKEINLLLDYYNLMYPQEVTEKKVFDFSGVIENDGKPLFNNAKTKTLLESIEQHFQSRLQPLV